jgi:hypothetical protein
MILNLHLIRRNHLLALFDPGGTLAHKILLVARGGSFDGCFLEGNLCDLILGRYPGPFYLWRGRFNLFLGRYFGTLVPCDGRSGRPLGWFGFWFRALGFFPWCSGKRRLRFSVPALPPWLLYISPERRSLFVG